MIILASWRPATRRRCGCAARTALATPQSLTSISAVGGSSAAAASIRASRLSLAMGVASTRVSPSCPATATARSTACGSGNRCSQNSLPKYKCVVITSSGGKSAIPGSPRKAAIARAFSDDKDSSSARRRGPTSERPSSMAAIILETAVGQVRVCIFPVLWLGCSRGFGRHVARLRNGLRLQAQTRPARATTTCTAFH